LLFFRAVEAFGSQRVAKRKKTKPELFFLLVLFSRAIGSSRCSFPE